MSEDRQSSSERKSLLERVGDLFSNNAPNDQEALIDIARKATDEKVITDETLGIIEGAIEVADLHVRDIMIPRLQVVFLNQKQSIEEMLPILIESAHSRFPLLNSDTDKVEGVILAKDILSLLHTHNFDMAMANADIASIVRPPFFVPESKRLNTLLREFRRNRNHLAVVVDEYGAISGLVTIEDVLEEIVGEIEDEHDESEELCNRMEDGTWLIHALTPIEELNERLHIELSDEEFDTIGGLVVQAVGHMPQRGEKVVLGGWLFEVKKADSRRVHTLKAKPAEFEAEVTPEAV
ncbi:HlyC/CorC family transporter [Salinibius halmophilus]|uniref:HlyC/CorC family transporter n=1 Tax=Salinibius halmophilus TaxID=1853216 RepID=UPI000E661FE4|nr:transporter associated domain-containing protein [Salinibius halmophilus]